MNVVRLLVIFFLCVPAFAGAQSPNPTVLERSIRTDAAVARLSSEVEQLATEVRRLRSNSSSTATDQAITNRLNDLQKQLSEVQTANELEELRGIVSNLQAEVSTQATAIDAVETLTEGQITAINEIRNNSHGTRSGTDGLARQATALAILLALAAIGIGIFARMKVKKSESIVGHVAEELETVRRTQRGQAHDITELKRRAEPVVFPNDFDANIKALAGEEKYKPVIELDGEKYVVEFQVAEDSSGMLRVYGINGHHNPIQRKNARGVVARAAMNFRLTQRYKYENNPGGDNVVAIGTMKK